MPYYNSANMISIQTELWKTYSDDVKQNVKIILVDDGSAEDQKLSKLLPRDTGMTVELYEVLEDIPWNECGANNLGLHVCSSTWVLRNDFDYLIPKHTMDIVLHRQLDPNVFYLFPARYWSGPGQPPTPEGGLPVGPNIFLMTKDLFWRAGGYDEDFIGHHGSDMIFRWQLYRIAKEHRINDGHVEAVLNGSGHILPRDATRSYALLEQKKVGKVPISKDYMRFKWQRVY